MAYQKSDWFSTFFAEHRAALRRYLLRFVSSSEVAEDLAQEAFARVYAMRTGEIQSPRSFLFRAGYNLAIDYMRHQKIAGELPMDEADAASLESEAPTAEQQLGSMEELAMVHDALGDLPPKCRAVFMLLHFEGHSYKEVAQQMKLSETMVRKYAVRALEYCQVRLDQAAGI